MNSALVAIFGLVLFALGYFFYATFIERKIWQVDFSQKTPAVLKDDGLDYIPAKHWTVLFGHHFASIAGAGPIIGPVIACALFGWGPALLWIIIGSIFIGGVHDFSALMLSLRHHGATVGHVAESVISRRSRLVFSVFLWLACKSMAGNRCLAGPHDILYLSGLKNSGGDRSSECLEHLDNNPSGLCLYRLDHTGKYPATAAGLPFCFYSFLRTYSGLSGNFCFSSQDERSDFY